MYVYTALILEGVLTIEKVRERSRNKRGGRVDHGVRRIKSVHEWRED